MDKIDVLELLDEQSVSKKDQDYKDWRETLEEIKVANNGTNILTTVGDIVTLINGNMEANSLCVASLTDETKAGTVATEVASAVTAGGANDTGTGDVDGILMRSVDVTDGEATGALVLAGFVDLDKIGIEPSTNFKSKLPMIAFLRKD